MTFRRLPKTPPRRPQEGLKDFREAANTTQEVPNAIRTLHSSPSKRKARICKHNRIT